MSVWIENLCILFWISILNIKLSLLVQSSSLCPVLRPYFFCCNFPDMNVLDYRITVIFIIENFQKTSDSVSYALSIPILQWKLGWFIHCSKYMVTLGPISIGLKPGFKPPSYSPVGRFLISVFSSLPLIWIWDLGGGMREEMVAAFHISWWSSKAVKDWLLFFPNIMETDPSKGEAMWQD